MPPPVFPGRRFGLFTTPAFRTSPSKQSRTSIYIIVARIIDSVVYVVKYCLILVLRMYGDLTRALGRPMPPRPATTITAMGASKRKPIPRNHTTRYNYDARRRLRTTTYDGNKTTVYEYNGPCNLIGMTDQARKAVQYNHDFANQLTSVSTEGTGFILRPSLVFLPVGPQIALKGKVAVVLLRLMKVITNSKGNTIASIGFDEKKESGESISTTRMDSPPNRKPGTSGMPILIPKLACL